MKCPNRFALAFALVASLTACIPPDSRPPPQPGPANCGAQRLGRFIGAKPTPDVRAQIRAEVGDRPIRYYTEGDPITMDYSASRLNVELGADGRILRFRCG
jgi:Peptidase inhibitor I78 family